MANTPTAARMRRNRTAPARHTARFDVDLTLEPRRRRTPLDRVLNALGIRPHHRRTRLSGHVSFTPASPAEPSPPVYPGWREPLPSELDP
jgi:hypothetical protein